MKSILTLLSACCLLAQSQAAPRPNIVFIMADDQAPWTLGVAGNRQVPTPNMDRIAQEGAYFPQAFTPTPVCSPARGSIMTSRYGTELGITDWINPKADGTLGLDAKFLTWPRLLQQAGYATALFGKWHLGDLDEQHPTQRGYGTFVGFRGGGLAPKHPSLEKNGRVEQNEGFVVDLVADEAIAWLGQRNPTQPFAVSIHFREPHFAYLPVPEEDWAKVKDLNPIVPEPGIPGLDLERVKKQTRDYFASVTALDRNVGRILAALDRLHLADNTILIYTSDHGYNIGHHGLWHKGNAAWLLKPEALPPATPNIPAIERPNMFDTSIRIPLIIRWPGVIKGGTVNPHALTHLDWLPTFSVLSGAPIPSGTTIRGRDVSPLLRGEAKSWDEDIYAEYSQKHRAQVHMRMYRTPEWKLVRDFKNEGRDELFHLAADPGETRNLIADPSPAARAAYHDLTARIFAKMAEIHDPLLSQAQLPPR
mgnify:CR=1 FL=1